MKSIKSIRSHHFALSARPFEIPFFRLAISAASIIPKRSVKQASGCGNVAQISQKSSCPILDYDFAFEENIWYNWKIAFPNIVPRLFFPRKNKSIFFRWHVSHPSVTCCWRPHVIGQSTNPSNFDFFHILSTKIVLKQLF